MKPNISHTVPIRDAKARVCFLPFIGSDYDLDESFQGSIELGFASMAEAKEFYETAIASKCVEWADLRNDAPNCLRGHLVAFWPPKKYDWNDS